MSNIDTADRQDRRNALDAFAAAPTNHVQAPSVQPLAAPADRVFGAQAVAVYRDEARVLQKLTALGAAAGGDWFYRFPVKNKRKNTTDWIEGPSIKLANDLARIYGNCDVDVRVIDIGKEWIIYARFTDFETGYSLTRPFQQQKGGAKLGGDDDARRLDISLQIGVSKAIRNVVVNALQTFSDHAFEAARNSLVDRIGKDVQGWTARTVQGINNLGVSLDRVEFVVGRASKDWLAADVAKVIAMMKAIADGMATIEDTFPPKDKQVSEDQHDPETGEMKPNTDESKAQGGQSGQAGAAEAGPTGSEQTTNRSTGSNTTDNPNGPATTESQASQQTSSSPSDAGRAAPNASIPPKANAKGAAKADAKTGEAEEVIPTTEKQYEAYTTAWIAEFTSSAEGDARWKDEKKLRNKCNVSEEIREALKETLDKKLADLRAVGK